jgi:hypothetical protein
VVALLDVELVEGLVRGQAGEGQAGGVDEGTLGGALAMRPALMAEYSPKAFISDLSLRATILSPTAKPVTPSPTAVMTPENSFPAIWGNLYAKIALKVPLRCSASTGSGRRPRP